MSDTLTEAQARWAEDFTGLHIGRGSGANGGGTPDDVPQGVTSVDAAAPGAPGAPGRGGASPAKAPKPQKPVKVEGEAIGGNLRQLEETFKRATGQIIHTVEINALLLGAGIESACIDFREYAKDKIKGIKESEEREKLAMEILSVCAAGVSSGFAALTIEGEIAKEVFTKLAETTITVVKAKAEPKTSGDFEDFVDSLIVGAKQSGHDAGSAAIAIVRREITEAEKAFKGAKDDGVSLSKSKSYSFVEPFLFAESSKFDHLVQRHVGIPTPSQVNKLQIKMAGQMIQKFAEKYLKAVRSSSDPVKFAISDKSGEDSYLIANRAMQGLKKKHGFKYAE